MKINNQKEEILNYCTRKFLMDGFYKTTLDELAKEMKISKKTFYKYFTSKEELVEACALGFITNITNQMTEIVENSNSPVHIFIKISQTLGKTTQNITNKWMEDLKKYRPDLWIKMDDTRKVVFNKNFTKIVNLGQMEGLIIEGNPALLTGIVAMVIRSVMQPDFLVETGFTPNETFNMIMKIVIHGLLTDKGKTKLLENIIPGV